MAEAANDAMLIAIRRLGVEATDEKQKQNQEKPQENPVRQGGHANKSQNSRKNQDGQKKASEEDAGPQSVATESQTDRKGRRYAEVGQPASATRTSHADVDRRRDEAVAQARRGDRQ
jgi:hypothetical protein